MTYIEFFSPVVSENICTCLARLPERVVLIGDNRKLLGRHTERYRELFSTIDPDHPIEFIPRSVNKNDMKSVINALSELVEKYDDCVFDLTGGEDVYLVAVGIVSERYSARGLQLQRFNLRNGRVMDCDMDGQVVQELKMPSLTVEQNIRFFGGSIIRTGVSATYDWDLSPDFIADIALMWEICRQDAAKWNMLLKIFAQAESMDIAKNDPLLLRASLKGMRHAVYYANEEYLDKSEVLSYLMDNRLITHCDWEDGNLELRFKDPQIKKVLTKAGTLLELVMYFAAMIATDEDGNAVYNDVMTGVGINWNAAEEGEVIITHNEIDVIMMHGMVPVFVSCKSGIVEMEELFKFSTVAERFGGSYAKKVLVAPALAGLNNAESIRARALDMNIQLLEDTYGLPFLELKESVSGLWNTTFKRK